MLARLVELAAAGRTILVPNAELAASLQNAVERAHAASGRDVWATPQVREFGGWLRSEHERRQLTDSTGPRCLSDAEEAELWRRVVHDSHLAEQFLEPAGAARAARRARRALVEHGIPIAAIEAYGTLETRMFCRWNDEFSARCRALRCIGADDLLAGLGAEGAEGAERFLMAGPTAERLAWIESPAWRPVARRWLEQHAGAPLAPMSPTAPMASMASPAAEPSARAPRWRRFASPAAELAAMAEWAGERLRACGSFRAWICVPDLAARREELIDAFDAVLAPERFALDGANAASSAYAVAGGTALALHPVVASALQFLSTCFGPVPFAQFSELLRAPGLQHGAEEASLAVQLDLALRSRAPSEADLFTWLSLADRVAGAASLAAVPALQRLHTAAHRLRAERGRQPMSRWVALWIEAFESAPWSQRGRWSSEQYQSAQRLRELMAELAAGDALFTDQSHRAAYEMLERAARDTPFQGETGVPAIAVSGRRMDPWLGYDGLWIGGCDETQWPPAPEPVPLIPVRLQRQYGVIAAAERSQFALAEDLQRRWASRAAECVCSGADAGEGRAAAPSPLLDRAGEIEAAEPHAQPHWLWQRRVLPPLEPFVDERAPPFDPGERTRGVATLTAQSRCAFRGFAETRLETGALAQPVPGFNDAERGQLVHDALGRVWTRLLDSAGLARLDAPSRARLLDECARDAVAAVTRRRDPGARWRERERVRLSALLQRWLELESRRGAFEVLLIEGRDPRAAAGDAREGEQTVRLAGLELRFRVDRIDRLQDGGHALIDYKSGQVSADWRGERPGSAQLPLYAMSAALPLVAVAYGRINASECRFLPESERAGVFPGTNRPTAMEGAENLAELIRLWSARMERLAAEFAEGRAVLDPLPMACQSCSLSGLCRVASRESEGDDE